MSDQPQANSGDDQTSETTMLLRAWADGDQGALAQLTPRVYRTLRRIAGYQMQHERAGQSMQATALVHEAYLRLVDSASPRHWNSRGHFFGAAAEAMRRILVEQARRKAAMKAGGQAE